MQFVGLNTGLDNGDYFISPVKLITLIVIMLSLIKFVVHLFCKKYRPTNISICRRV